MSRIGKLPVAVPAGVTITVDGNRVSVTGPKGELSEAVLPEVTLNNEAETLTVARKNEEKLAKSQHGLMRALINNMVVGVTTGFEKKLEVNGVGFKVGLQGNKLVMSLGFSHPVNYESPAGVALSVDKNVITVSGISKQQVGQTAAEIRSLKKPEPYKGKGIKYENEHILRKSGKTGAK